MIYENDKIMIRPFTKDDISDKYRSWFFDSETTKYNSHGLFPYTKEQAEAFVKDLEGSTIKIVWAIIQKTEFEKIKNRPFPFSESEIKERRDGGIHVGNISLQSINLHNRSAELAIVIGEADARGKGYGLQVCQLVLNHGFNKIGLNRIWTGTAATNIAMQKVCEKLGMQQEGVFREGMFLNGEYVDVYAYGILKGEYLYGKELNKEDGQFL